MNKKYDIVVVGAGHNTLTAAAYLARCGLSVLVLERNSYAGGGAVSRQVTLPGFVHDTHATNVNLLQRHPLLAKDELGLLAKFGLKFSFPKISYMTIFDDATSLACYMDRDKSYEEIARYSTKDAEAYRSMVKFIEGLGPMVGMTLARPPVSFGALVSMLERIPGGDELVRAMLLSGYDVINERFEHPKVRMHFLRWAGEMLISPFEKTSGMALLLLIGAAHSSPGGVAIGGTQKLTDALIQSIEHDGGEVRVNCAVRRVINTNGTAKTIELEDGQRITATKAVIAAIHPHLLGEMVEGLDDGLVQRAKRTKVAPYGGMSIHAALNERPNWIVGDQPHECMSINLIDYTSFEDFERSFDDLRYKQIPKSFNCYANVHTNHDPTRAPQGKHILNVFKWGPYELKDGGAARWDDIRESYADSVLERLRRFAPNLGGDNILARHIETPLDHSRHSPSFQRGDITGLAAYTAQMFGMRPTVELSQYGVPGAEGLYLAGPFMHPGGGLMGGGRPLAIRIMEQLKVNYESVIRS